VETAVFEFLRALLTERRQTSPFPQGSTAFPERFRGRPALSCAADTDQRGDAVGRVPTGSVRNGPRNLPVIDLGACLFSPEEAIEDGMCRLRYTPEIEMSARTRENLVTPTGDVTPVAALDAQMRRILGRSLRLRSVVAGSCAGCEAELTALGNVVFDMARFGVQFVASPRHADGIVITGVVNQNMVSALERTYAAVPDPRIVIAVGACAASGGPFRGSPAVAGIPASIPVDLWIPGCPPHPLTVLDGLLRLLGRIDGSSPDDATVASSGASA
jgi:Ni,Fe-hydrogenase III small subunit